MKITALDSENTNSGNHPEAKSYWCTAI